MMTKRLFTSSGRTVHLGRELGRGGEGSVYEADGADLVAKVYHQAPDNQKQAKLSFMARAADKELLSYTAWPQETLHAKPNGPVVGFLMGKVAGKQPVHEIYSPAHRRQEHPNLALDFLIYVARNIAAAFDVLHSHGHVLGDVNQGNVMVGVDSKVVLIDSDSYQINAHGTLHLCEVGVGHFTPPELQGIHSFRGVTRTPNHDNFGLALLIFHLLIGGRHPFAGVATGVGIGEQLETDIKAYRYAYGPDAASRGLSPPPRCVPIGILPLAMRNMFYTAFTSPKERLRPSAKEWLKALDELRKSVRACAQTPTHVFPSHLPDCPWCTLEQQGVVFFVHVGRTGTSPGHNGSGFNIEHIWAKIETVKVPLAATRALPLIAQPTPKPLPADVKPPVPLARALVILAAIGMIAADSKSVGDVLLIGTFFWLMLGPKPSAAYSNEKERRELVAAEAEKALSELVCKLQDGVGPEAFNARKRQLRELYEEYKVLPAREAREIANLSHTAEARQRHRFLDAFFIDKATIPGVGPGRKAALRSFGIETAADVKRERVSQVKGFGPGLTQAMIDWRASCERRFVFNRSQAVTDTDRQVVRSDIYMRRVVIESILTGAPSELEGIVQKGAKQAAELHRQLVSAVQHAEQARADLKVL